MPRFEILHHIPCLQGAGFRDGAREEVDDDGVLIGGRDDEGEEKLGELGDAGDGVEIGFAESADAHDGEEEGEEDGDEGSVEGDEGAEDDVDAGDAEDYGGDEAEEGNPVADEVFGRGVEFGDVGFFVFWWFM